MCPTCRQCCTVGRLCITQSSMLITRSQVNTLEQEIAEKNAKLIETRWEVG